MMTLDRIKAAIDDAIGKDALSTEDAVAWLEELSADIESRLEALHEDLRNR